MTEEKAIQTLINAVALAQQKGVFSLLDAKYVINAVEFLSPTTLNPVPEEEETK